MIRTGKLTSRHGGHVLLQNKKHTQMVGLFLDRRFGGLAFEKKKKKRTQTKKPKQTKNPGKK